MPLGRDSLDACLKISPYTFDCSGPWVAALPQIEYKSRISHNISAKSGRSRFTTAQKFFYFSEQMHLSIPYSHKRLGCSPLPVKFLLV